MSNFITKAQFQNEKVQKTLKDLGFITEQGKRIFTVDKRYAGGMITIWFDGRVEQSVTRLGTVVSDWTPAELQRLLSDLSEVYSVLATTVSAIDGLLKHLD